MNKAALTVFVAFMAVNSVHLLPRGDFVQPNTLKNIKRLKNLRPNDLAEELSGQFEGDIVISPEQKNELFNDRSGRTVLIENKYRWPNNIVPYEFRDEGEFTTAHKNYITLGLQKIMDVTCFKFVPYDPNVHKNWIYITAKPAGCHSRVGMQGGGQQLNIQLYDPEVGCFRLYTIVHEFMHAIGIYHMQSATERDEYVKIVWENIDEKAEHNFRTHNSSFINQYGIEYDYGSVMHYSKKAFSTNDQDTIVPLKDLGDNVMGQRLKMSEKDIARINAKFCKAEPQKPPNLRESIKLLSEIVNNILKKIFGKS